MVPRPLQNLGGDSPLVHNGDSTRDCEFNSCVLCLKREREREREGGREGSHRVNGGIGREAWVNNVIGLCWGQTDDMVD